jgi:hypothetical protein
MADIVGNDIRELQRRISKLEQVLLDKGILEAPAPPEKILIESVVNTVIASAIQPWGGNGRWTQATIEINHCGKTQMLNVDFNGFGVYQVRCCECKKMLSTDVRWKVGNAKT